MDSPPHPPSNRLAALNLVDPCKDGDDVDELKNRQFGWFPAIDDDESDGEFDLAPFGHREFPVRKNALLQRHMSSDIPSSQHNAARNKILPVRRTVSDDFFAQACKAKNDCQPSCSIFGIRGKATCTGKGKNKESTGFCPRKCSPACCPGKYWDVVGDPNNGKHGSGEKHNYTGMLKSCHGFSSVAPFDTCGEERHRESIRGVDVTGNATDKSEETEYMYAPIRFAADRTAHDGFSPQHGKNNEASHDGESCSSFFGIYASGDKKESNARGVLPVGVEPFENLSSRPSQKKLSGCVSPDKLKLSNNDMQDNHAGNYMPNELSDANSSDFTKVANHRSRSYWFDGRKGKAVVSGDVTQFSKGMKDNSVLDRNSFRPGEEAFDISDISNGTFISSTGIDLISGMENTSKETINILKKNIFSNVENRVCPLLNKSHETRRGDRNCIDPVRNSHEIISTRDSNSNQVQPTSVPEKEAKRCHRHQKLAKNSRKGRLLDSHYGECSGFSTGNSEISCIQAPRRGSNMRFSRNYNIERHTSALEPVREIDDLDSGGTHVSHSQGENLNSHNNQSTRVDQVESDEILARRLQEQFNQELENFRGGDEIDATIALSLQEEEDVWMASIPRPSQVNARDASMAHLYSHRRNAPRNSFYQQQPDQISASSRMSQLRRNLNHADMDSQMGIMSQLRRRLTRPEMDLDMQLNILETFEAALGNRENRANSGGLFSAQRDFTGDDYELLLALDNNIRRVGATEHQLNTLPQSVAQSNNSEEVCTVCLEVPSAGDFIRHLPCLHKFHKECIDTWLRTKASCPICKSGIT